MLHLEKAKWYGCWYLVLDGKRVGEVYDVPEAARVIDENFEPVKNALRLELAKKPKEETKEKLLKAFVALAEDKKGKSYKVIVKGEVIGQIWQEYPDLFADDWTVGLKTMPMNTVGSLEKVKGVALEKHPDAQILDAS
jgi:hypothetical protein